MRDPGHFWAPSQGAGLPLCLPQEGAFPSFPKRKVSPASGGTEGSAFDRQHAAKESCFPHRGKIAAGACGRGEGAGVTGAALLLCPARRRAGTGGCGGTLCPDPLGALGWHWRGSAAPLPWSPGSGQPGRAALRWGCGRRGCGQGYVGWEM